MQTVALTLVLFLAIVLVVVPLAVIAASLARRLRTRLQLAHMRRQWRARNHRRTFTGSSRPLTGMLTVTLVDTTH